MRSILVFGGSLGRSYSSRDIRDNCVGTGTYICRTTSVYRARRNEKIGNKTQYSAVLSTILPENASGQRLVLFPTFHVSTQPTLICLRAFVVSLLKPDIPNPR